VASRTAGLLVCALDRKGASLRTGEKQGGVEEEEQGKQDVGAGKKEKGDHKKDPDGPRPGAARCRAALAYGRNGPILSCVSMANPRHPLHGGFMA